MSLKFVKRDDRAGEEDDEYYPVDLPPLEIVFSLDHVLDQIFSYLDIPDLLTCRLVSYRFLKLAQTSLEEQIILVFDDYSQKIRNGKEFIGKTLYQLSQFLNKSLSARASASVSKSASTVKLISLPCIRFNFKSAGLGDQCLQNFLIINGPNIRELSVHSSGKNERLYERVLREQLCNLTVQASHLESFSLHLVHPIIVDWLQEIPIQGSINLNSLSRSHRSPLLKTDPEFEEISSKVESWPRKSSLKFFHISAEGVAKTVECLLQLSPKLEEVVFNPGDYQYLLQPVNRVHLLKSLAFDPDLQNNLDNYYRCNKDTMETISLDSNLKLRELKVNFQQARYEFETNREFKKMVVVIFNRLLEGSKNTLEVLDLDCFAFLPGMKIPCLMPNVWKIEVGDFEGGREENSTVFPLGFSLSETFPKLTCVKLGFVDEYDEVEPFYDYLKFLDFGGDGESVTLSLGVNKVILDSGCFRTEDFTTIPTYVSDKIQQLFPNAVLEIHKLIY